MPQVCNQRRRQHGCNLSPPRQRVAPSSGKPPVGCPPPPTAPLPLAPRSGTRDGWAWRAAAQLLETLTKEMMFFFFFLPFLIKSAPGPGADSLTAEMSGNGALRNRRSSDRGVWGGGWQTNVKAIVFAQGAAPHAVPSSDAAHRPPPSGRVNHSSRSSSKNRP